MCNHEPKPRRVGYGASRRVDGYKCIKCGETDITNMLPRPALQAVDPKSLIEWEDNQNERKIESLMDAMESGDDVPPILTNASGNVLYDGHHRAEAARRLGYTIKAICIPSEWNDVIGSRLPDLERAISSFEL